VKALTALKSFARFWYDFVVGDDWHVAVGVVAALTATWGLTRAGVNAWWLPALAVALLLGWSLARVVKAARRQ
jgi:hypothetical protein